MKIGLYGSCQLNLCYNFFFNNEVITKNNIQVLFSLKFTNYFGQNEKILDYSIFDDIDILIIEINTLENQASSNKIIEYCLERNIKIVKTFIIKFPVYPINWSHLGDYEANYLNWNGLDKIDYKKKFNECMLSCRKLNIQSDLSIEISDFIEYNFNKQLLFIHSLHPTNVLLFQLWKNIFKNISLNIEDYNYVFDYELLNYTDEFNVNWNNPFTSKMIKDLDIQFDANINDDFYVKRYEENWWFYNKFIG